MLILSQVFVIARNEIRFGFRRGAPVVVTVLIGLLLSAGIMTTPLANLPDWTTYTVMTPDKVARLASNGLTPSQWVTFIHDFFGDMFVASTLMAWLLVFIALLLLPMATSGSIPADRKFGVSEMLRSMPISGFTYLAGKILGMIVTVLLVGALMFGLFFSVTEMILFSSLHYGLYATAIWFLIEIALLDGLPMLVFGATIGVLVGTFFRTRRAAILPSLLAGAASLVCWAYAFRAPAKGAFNGMTDLAYYYLLQNYRSPAMDLMTKLGGPAIDLFGIKGAPRVGIGQLTLMYLAIVAALAILTGLARLWVQWKENF